MNNVNVNVGRDLLFLAYGNSRRCFADGSSSSSVMWARGMRYLATQPVVVPVRALSLSPRSSVSFKVQDYKDFDDRVKNSRVPVIVDFYATYDYRNAY